MRRVLVVGLVIVAAVVVWLVVRGGRREKQAGEQGRTVMATGERERPEIRMPRIAPKWFRQAGAPDRRVAGRVVYDREPVEGARVSLWSELVGAGLMDEPATVTGADGRFDLGAWPAGRWFVSAEADGLAPAGAWLALHDPMQRPEPDRLELVLGGCETSVHGVVEDASGGPVVGAKVVIFTGGRARGETDGEGRYDLCTGEGTASIRVDAESYATAEAKITAYGRMQQDFALVPAVTIAGQVAHAEDGTPVVGARIVARRASDGDPADGDRGLKRAMSDDDGAFAVTGLRAGRYELRATADGLAPADTLQVTVGLETGHDPVVIQMAAAHPLTGVILEDDRPVAGARITARGANVTGAISQRDGSFVIDHMKPGPATLVVHDYELLEPTELTIDSGATQSVTVRVVSRATIRGHVTVHGAPAGEGTVRAGSVSATIRPDGTFELRGLEPGAYEVQAESRAAGAFSRKQQITVDKGQVVDGVVLELDQGASIAGTVVDTQGAPVSGVTVRFSLVGGQDTAIAGTAEDGSFIARKLAGGGEYTATINGPGGASTYRPPGGRELPRVRLPSSATQLTGVRFEVERPTLVIAGIALRAGGAPVADAAVVALALEPDKPVLARASTAVDGTFVLRELPAGKHLVRVVAGNVSESIPVEAGRDNLVVIIPDTGGVEGNLVGFGADAKVSIRGGSHGYRVFRVTPAGGRFKQGDLAPGKYWVEAADSAGGAEATVEIKSGEVVEVTLTPAGRR